MEYKQTRILVIIPAFNEGVRIGPVIAATRAAVGGTADVLVVSDGSGDDTVLRAREAGAHVVSLPLNIGYGCALKAGYLYAQRNGYDVVVQLDGDGQHDPSSIPSLLAPILSGAAQVVVGSRFLGHSTYSMPPLRRLGQRLFSYLLRVLSGKQVTDPTSGFQALSHTVFSLYVSDEVPGDYPDTDVLLMLHYRGIIFTEVPALFHARQGGTSMHDGLRSLFYIYKMSFSMLVVAYRYRFARMAQ